MRAAWYNKTGVAAAVLTVGEMPTPEAAPGEVRVRLAASGVNPADVKLRAGLSSYGYDFPQVIPNSDGAGVVDQIGRDVDASLLGRRVWLFNGQRLGRAFGTAAEFIALDANLVTPLPDAVSFAEGATLGIPAMTAHHAVFADGPVAGKTILVSGGAGAVGFYAVSLAAWAGARVIVTVSSDEKAEFARQGGAVAAINYRRENVAERVAELTDGAGVARLVSVDFGGDLPWLPEVVAANGSVAAYASDGDLTPAIPFRRFMARNIMIRPFILNGLGRAALDAARFGVLSWLMAQPTALRPVAEKFSLQNIVAAHEFVESGQKRGTVVVTP
jgi:NADPH2:quinone reductase